MRERSRAVACGGGEGRGRDGPFVLACGPGPVWLKWAIVAGLLLVWTVRAVD